MGVPRAIADLPRLRVFLDNFELMRASVFGTGTAEVRRAAG
jgi:hypothetical protein